MYCLVEVRSHSKFYINQDKQYLSKTFASLEFELTTKTYSNIYVATMWIKIEILKPFEALQEVMPPIVCN